MPQSDKWVYMLTAVMPVWLAIIVEDGGERMMRFGELKCKFQPGIVSESFVVDYVQLWNVRIDLW